jgi:hypothetical protein
MVRPLTLLALVAFTSSCGLLGKKVSEEDCAKWDKHYRESLEASAKKKLAKCKDDPAAKAWLKSLEENVALSADGLATGCHSVQRIGGYTAEEEKCFLGSDDAKAWSKCEFKPTSAVKMYATSAEAWMKSVDAMCKGKSESDEETDDEPKKKKKKKPSDDDE